MKVINSSILMTRGDSESLTVKCFQKSGGERTAAPFETGDTVTMTVRKDANGAIQFQKIVTDFDENGWAVIPIAHDDTKDLPFGAYVYDIQLTRSDGTVTTIVTISDFKLLEEVTY